jgi:thiol-disulfide isomerase/thioredoxin
MRKISDRDINFLLNAVILALIIMAVLHAVQPIVDPPKNRDVEVQAHMKDLVPIRPMKVGKMLESKDGKPSVVLVYASWCPYCRKLMPELVSLIKEKQFEGAHLYFVSLDHEPEKLSHYLVYNDYMGIFTPYIAEKDTGQEMSGILSLTGSGYKGQMPYVGFFDKDGKMVAETFGMVNKKRLLEGFQSTLAKP